jgi:murein DD-endopeptidase MepM/ murein hydrolase activator NlpD
LVLLLCLGAAAGGLWIRAEGGAPRVEAPALVVLGGTPRTLEIALADDGSGLREVSAVLTHARGEEQLLVQGFSGSLLTGGGSEREPLTLALDARALGLPEGDAFLRLSVRDWSWRGGLRGNETRAEIPVRVDLTPPRIEVASGLTYVRRGGAGAVAYTVSEESARDGVLVGERFYRGFPVGSGAGGPGRRFALFAVATDAATEPSIGVIAEDAAGNRARVGWSVVVQPRAERAGNVTLPKSFLEQKVRPLAERERIATDDLVAAFGEINTRLRQSNETQIREILGTPAAEGLWRGSFEQLANSEVTSHFAEHRLYFVDGVRISEATHYGYDLASRAGAPITAANGGRVAFADYLGIYGNCVLIDHGLGLASLYGHLSRIDVAAGDRVEKGQTLGVSGETGLAGGDHLHFAMLVGDTYVDPVEWWDPSWVRTHIDVHLGSPSEAPSAPPS